MRRRVSSDGVRAFKGLRDRDGVVGFNTGLRV